MCCIVVIDSGCMLLCMRCYMRMRMYLCAYMYVCICAFVGIVVVCRCYVAVYVPRPCGTLSLALNVCMPNTYSHVHVMWSRDFGSVHNSHAPPKPPPPLPTKLCRTFNSSRLSFGVRTHASDGRTTRSRHKICVCGLQSGQGECSRRKTLVMLAVVWLVVELGDCNALNYM